MRTKEDVSKRLEESLQAEMERFNLFQNNYLSLSNSYPGQWAAVPRCGEIIHDLEYSVVVRSLEAKGMTVKDFYIGKLKVA